MHVFLTGGKGFLGSALIPELLNAGHTVVALARSDSAAQKLTLAGASVLRGSLTDLSVLAQGAASSDGVIHAAFIHDFTDYVGACATDKAAIDVIATALEGSGRPLVITSGTLGVAQSSPATEDEEGDPRHSNSGRLLSEKTALSYAERGVRVSIVRLPPSVYGDNDVGFVPIMIKTAREMGFSAYISDGLNRWPTVHRLDAVRLFRLALEKGETGSRFHGVAEEGLPLRDIAEAIGRHLNIPAVSKSTEEVSKLLGFTGFAMSMDNPTSSTKTQAQLSWRPEQPTLFLDLEQGSYFNS